MNTKTMNEEALKHPTQTQINACRVVFKAMANEELVREQIEPRQEYVLQLIKATNKRTGEAITKAKDSYLMSDEQFNDYLEEMRHEYKTLGYDSDKYQKEGCCPLLVAEDLTRQAKHALILAMEESTGITHDMLFSKYGMYDKYVDLNLRYLVGFIKK